MLVKVKDGDHHEARAHALSETIITSVFFNGASGLQIAQLPSELRRNTSKGRAQGHRYLYPCWSLFRDQVRIR